MYSKPSERRTSGASQRAGSAGDPSFAAKVSTRSSIPSTMASPEQLCVRVLPPALISRTLESRFSLLSAEDPTQSSWLLFDESLKKMLRRRTRQRVLRLGPHVSLEMFPLHSSVSDGKRSKEHQQNCEKSLNTRQSRNSSEYLSVRVTMP